MRSALFLLFLTACSDPPMPDVFDGAGRISQTCSPVDAPSVALELGLTDAACDAAPGEGARFVFTVYGEAFPPAIDASLAFTNANEGAGTWFSGPEDSAGVPIESGRFRVLEDSDGLRYGDFFFLRADGVEVEGALTAVDCAALGLCG
jgi:hypothetical protein